jgi:hypothetical protein
MTRRPEVGDALRQFFEGFDDSHLASALYDAGAGFNDITALEDVVGDAYAVALSLWNSL